MTSFSISKELLLPALSTVAGAVDKKQAFPILANFLIKIEANQLVISATDLEIEITAQISLDIPLEPLMFTVPAKKMMDIIRALDDNCVPLFTLNADIFSIKSGRSHFKLATMQAIDYPRSKDELATIEMSLSRQSLIHLLQSTHFAISQQEVRAYLNGLLLEFNPQHITAVATDGHRLAYNQLPINESVSFHRILLPRKGVLEVLKLLTHVNDDIVEIRAGAEHFKLLTKHYSIHSRLIESRFPPYAKAIPIDHDKSVTVDKDLLKRSLTRIVILANEKSRAVVLHVETNLLTIIANNQEKEEAFDSIEAETTGSPIKIGINASYLIDVLSFISDGVVRISFGSENDSILVESISEAAYRYIIMPMKI